MAQQLQAAGEEVTLAVLDSRPPQSAPSCTRSQALLRLAQLLEMRAGRALGIDAQALAGLDHQEQVALLLARATAVNLLPPSTRPRALEGILRVFETNLNTGYAPRARLRGTLYYGAAGNGVGGGYAAVDTAPPHLAGWAGHADTLSQWKGPGNHMTMLEQPHVAALGEWLQSLLRTN